ncbi:MAG TPA: hypothetical protein VG892_07920 [Terriglobales bacterium]|nr:hypothetical protein [Terriglobales bacterium]
MSERIAIVAAMEREVRPLVKGWEQLSIRGLPAWKSGATVVVCGGIGSQPARLAAESVVAMHRPTRLISAGFAGSLEEDLNPPDVVFASRVLDAVSKLVFTCEGFHERDAEPEHKQATLLTVSSIAEVLSKQEMARQFAAQIVDMEAAAVAEVAVRNGIRFHAIKAISEGLHFPLPPIQPFVSPTGGFRTGRFLLYIALRPHFWGPVRQLKRTTSWAAKELCRSLDATCRNMGTLQAASTATQGIGC